MACIFLNVTTKGRQTNTQTSCFCFKGHKYATEFCLSLTPFTRLNCRMQSTSAHMLACEEFWMNVCWDWYKLTCGLGMKWFDTLLKCTLTSLNYWALFFRTNDRFFQTIPKRPLCNRPNCAKYDKKNKGLNSFLTNLYLFWLILLSYKKGSHNMAKINNKNYIGLHDIITLKSVLYRVGRTLKVLSRDHIQNTYSMKELPC